MLGYQTALDLFEGDDPIGQTVWVNRKSCQVIGVLAELEAVNLQDRINTRPNEGLFLPISFAIQNLFDTEPWVTVIAHVTDESKMEEAKAQIAAYLRQRHGITQGPDGKYADDFHMTTKQDVLGAQQQSAADIFVAAYRAGYRLAGCGRHRDHERDVGECERAHARDRRAHGGGRARPGCGGSVSAGGCAVECWRRPARDRGGCADGSDCRLA